MKKQPVTFSDIAAHTGFSKNTISRYFNRPETLTPANRQIIETALQELSYQENKVARILASGRTEFIGVIVPNLKLTFYAELLDRLIDHAARLGYKLLVFTGNGQPEVERQYLRELLAYKIEGLIMLSHAIPSAELATYPVPVVGIEREDAHIHSVNTDNHAGGQAAARLLQECGCEVFIHINSQVTPASPAYGRISGFREYCEGQNLHCEILQVDWAENFADNQQKMAEIAAHLAGKYPDWRKGIFVSNDNNASCLLNLLFRRYGRLPEDWRIVGFDDSAASAEAILPISTIGQQLELIAFNAMELLIMQMEEGNRAEQKEHRVIPVTVVTRGTA